MKKAQLAAAILAMALGAYGVMSTGRAGAGAVDGSPLPTPPEAAPRATATPRPIYHVWRQDAIPTAIPAAGICAVEVITLCDGTVMTVTIPLMDRRSIVGHP